MRKGFSVVMVAAALAGCATTAPLQQTANGHTLTGTMDTLTGHLVVIVDGRAVIDGQLNALGNTGALTGTLDGQAVAAVCVSRYAYSECTVTLANQPLGVLTF